MTNQPRSAADNNGSDNLPKPTSERSTHIGAALALLPASLVIAMLVTPADPISMVIATVPIFPALFGAYLFGFRSGLKEKAIP